MTIQDIIMAIKMELDKSTISNLPSFTEDEYCYFVNKAYGMVVNQKFTGHNVLQQGFEDSKKRIADLQGLMKNTRLQNNPSAFKYSKNEIVFETGDVSDILYPINSIIEINTLSGETKDMTTIEVKHEEADPFRETTENNPWIPNPVILYSKDRIIALLDRVLLNEMEDECYLKMLYLKRPVRLTYWNYDGSGNKTINLSGDATQIPEISEHVHYEIISLATDLMLDNIESQRIQTHPQINQGLE